MNEPAEILQFQKPGPSYKTPREQHKKTSEIVIRAMVWIGRRRDLKPEEQAFTILEFANGIGITKKMAEHHLKVLVQEKILTTQQIRGRFRNAGWAHKINIYTSLYEIRPMRCRHGFDNPNECALCLGVK